MSLYLLKRFLHGHGGHYDENHGMVIRASSARAARRLAAAYAQEHGDEDPGEWSDPKRSSCLQQTPDGPNTIILVDFNAG